MIVRGPRQLRSYYHRLSAGDIYIGPVTFAQLKTFALIDLKERGVHCVPAALAQLLNSSKVAQAHILQAFMLPLTRVITRRRDMLAAIQAYAQDQVAAVVTKNEHLHCGHGIRRWDDLEAAYNQLAFDRSVYPFVLQPYLEGFEDVRVIIAADYEEAYVRHNPFSFRNNLAGGGGSRNFTLTPALQDFCRKIMGRGRFPYAHIDLQLTDDGSCYLSEIALNGGIKGARIHRVELDRRKEAELERLAAALAGGCQDQGAENLRAAPDALPDVAEQ